MKRAKPDDMEKRAKRFARSRGWVAESVNEADGITQDLMGFALLEVARVLKKGYERGVRDASEKAIHHFCTEHCICSEGIRLDILSLLKRNTSVTPSVTRGSRAERRLGKKRGKAK